MTDSPEVGVHDPSLDTLVFPSVPVSDELDDEWPTKGPAKGVHVRVPTLVLVGLLVAAGALWGGAALQRSQGSSGNGASALASRLRAFAGTAGASGFTFGRGGFGGARGAGAAGANALVGTVTLVKGNTLYVTNAAGSLVKVSLGSSTTITKSSTITAAGLLQGDTVVVTGATAKNGAIAATRVVDGVPSTSSFGAGSASVSPPG
jgi:hypothetical protein